MIDKDNKIKELEEKVKELEMKLYQLTNPVQEAYLPDIHVLQDIIDLNESLSG